MKKFTNYFKTGVFVLASIFISCNNDLDDETEQSLETPQEELQLVDISFKSDLENFDKVVYKGDTYTMEEVLSTKKLFDLYKNAKVTVIFDESEGVDDTDKSSDEDKEKSALYLFDNPEIANRQMARLSNPGPQQREIRDKFTFTLQMYDWRDFNWHGGELRYTRTGNNGVLHTRAMQKNVPSNWHDRISSIVIRSKGNSRYERYNGQYVQTWERVIYMDCYEHPNRGGRKSTIRLTKTGDEWAKGNLGNFEDIISSVRVGDNGANPIN